MVNLVPDSALPAQSSFGNELVLFAADNDIILHSVDNIGERHVFEMTQNTSQSSFLTIAIISCKQDAIKSRS